LKKLLTLTLKSAVGTGSDQFILSVYPPRARRPWTNPLPGTPSIWTGIPTHHWRTFVTRQMRDEAISPTACS
jgi:hypothetical protein